MIETVQFTFSDLFVGFGLEGKIHHMRHVTHSEDVYEEQEAQEADGAVGRDSKHRVAETSLSGSHEATTGSI